MVLKGHRSVVRSASISVDDSRAVTIGEDHTVRQWDVKNGAQLSVSAIDDAMFENLAGRHGFAEAPGIALDAVVEVFHLTVFDDLGIRIIPLQLPQRFAIGGSYRC